MRPDDEHNAPGPPPARGPIEFDITEATATIGRTLSTANDLKSYYEALQLRRQLGWYGSWRSILSGFVVATSAFALYVSILNLTLASANSARDSAQIEERHALAARDLATKERDAAQVERDSAFSERDAARVERDSAISERDAAFSARDSALQSTTLAEAARDDALDEKKKADADSVVANAEREHAVFERDRAQDSARHAEVAIRRTVRFLGTTWRTGSHYTGPSAERDEGLDLVAKLVASVGDRCRAKQSVPRNLRLTLGPDNMFQYVATSQFVDSGYLHTCSGVGRWHVSRDELTLLFCRTLLPDHSKICRGGPLLVLRAEVPSNRDVPDELFLNDGSGVHAPFKQMTGILW